MLVGQAGILKRAYRFLSTFVKLRKVGISFVAYVHREQLGSHWIDFCEIYLSYLWKTVEKIQVSSESDKNNEYFTFMIISRWILCRMRNVSDESYRKPKHTFYVQYIYIYIYIFFFFSPENPSFYEIIWKHKLEPVSPHIPIRRMWITCWITKTIYTHSEYIILFVLPR